MPTLRTPVERLALLVAHMTDAIQYTNRLTPTAMDVTRWRDELVAALEDVAMEDAAIRRELIDLRTTLLQARGFIAEARRRIEGMS